MDETTDTSNFQLSHMDTAFASRSNDVFSCLDSIEEKHKTYERNQFDTCSEFFKPDPTEEPVACKTNFKIPKGIPWKTRIPDYKVRPNKWKTYSLLDVSPDQMSDFSNKKTALEFIDSLRNRGACTDATDQKDDDSMDTCTDTEVGEPCLATHKQHLFRKPPVQTLKKQMLDEHQLAYKSLAQIVDVGPKLWIQQTKYENEEASSEDVNSNLNDDTESSFDDTLRLSTKADSADVHFKNKGLKGKSKSIRPRILADENEDDEDRLALKDKCVQETEGACSNDESDEFSDYAVENSYTDEELLSGGLADSEHDGNYWSDLKSEEHGNGSDEDVHKQAEEFAFVDSIHSNACFVFAQGEDSERQNCEKDGYCIDDLDAVD